MKYGAMNNPAKPILSEVETIAGLGFDFLELTMDPPYAHHNQVRTQQKTLLDLLRDHELELICHMPTFVSLADLTPTIRQASIAEVLSSLDVAAALKPLKIVVHPPYIGGMGGYVHEYANSLAMDSLAIVVERATELQLEVCLENMFPRTRFCVEPDDFSVIFNQFPDIHLTLDCGHANIGSVGDRRILEFIKRWSDRIHHLHVSDNFGKEDNHLPLGTGTIQFSKMIKQLKAHGYDRSVTFEIFSQDREYLSISRKKFERLWQVI